MYIRDNDCDEDVYDVDGETEENDDSSLDTGDLQKWPTRLVTLGNK